MTTSGVDFVLPGEQWDFLLSYAASDRVWAEWVAWQLESANYRVLIKAWDFVPGSNWSSHIQAGIVGSRRTILVLSAAYLRCLDDAPEWQAAIAANPSGSDRRLLPVRVEECEAPGLLARLAPIDLFDVSPESARDTLLQLVRHALDGRAKPTAEPAFPRRTPAAPATRPAPAFPASIPRPAGAPSPASTPGPADVLGRTDRPDRFVTPVGVAVPAGAPRIDFRAHQVRAGTEGARHEFEQMIALLVQRTVGEARQIVASGGDWGIDVMVGDLGERITIWQAKYFIDGFGSGQFSQVKSSFGRAREGAAKGRYEIERWVLCVPCDLTHKMLGTWQRWSKEQTAQTGIPIDLWDATALTSLLLDKRMNDLRRSFYDPYGAALPEDAGRHGDHPSARLRTTADQTASHDPPVWQGGGELLVGERSYLLHDPVETRTATDRSWLLRDATADELDGATRRVRVRQLQVRRATAASAAVRAGLAEQADLLHRLAGTPGVPGRLGWDITSSRATLVTSLVPAPTWREVHGGGARALDRLAAAAMLGRADDLCRTLTVLHRRGLAHGQLTPDSVLLVDGRRRTALRDLGFAGFGPAATSAVTSATVTPAAGSELSGGEFSGGDPRARDVRQVAALVRQSLGLGPGWPDLADLTALLDRALHPSPAERPAILELADGLRAARRRLSAGR